MKDLNLIGFGPFDIPKKDKWLIVGSGPTASYRHEYLADNNFGIIALNSTINFMTQADIVIFSHYEDVFHSFLHMKKADLVFLPNPIHVGYRCVPMDPMNMFDFKYFEDSLPGRVRFFKKCESVSKTPTQPNSLYCESTIATAALHLLVRNDVKDIYVCGVDGGRSRSADMQSFYDFHDAITPSTKDPIYNRAREEFEKLAKHFKVDLKRLDEIFAHA